MKTKLIINIIKAIETSGVDKEDAHAILAEILHEYFATQTQPQKPQKTTHKKTIKKKGQKLVTIRCQVCKKCVNTYRPEQKTCSKKCMYISKTNKFKEAP